MIDVNKILQGSAYLDNLAPTSRENINTASSVLATKAPGTNFSPMGVIGAVGGMVADGLSAIPNMISGNIRDSQQAGRLQDMQSRYDAVDKQHTDLLAQHAKGIISNDAFAKAKNDLYTQYQAIGDQAKSIQQDYYAPGAAAKDAVNAIGTVGTLAAPWLKAGALGATALAGAADAADTASVAGKVLSVGAKAVGGIEKGLGIGTRAVPTTLPAVGKYVAGSLARNTLAVQPTLNTAMSLPTDLKNKDFSKLAADSAILASPAIIGSLARLSKTLGPKLSTALYGKEGFFGAVSRMGGTDYLSHLDTLTGTAKTKAEGILRVVAQHQLDEFGGNTQKAAASWVQYAKTNGVDLTTLTPKQGLAELNKWVTANRHAVANLAENKALVGPAGEKYVLKDGEHIFAARWDSSTKKNLMEQLATANSADDRTAMLAQHEKDGTPFTKNKFLMDNLKQQVAKEDWNKGMPQAMRGLATGANGAKLPGGYVMGVSKNVRADFKKIADTAVLDRGVAPGKVLGRVGNALIKAGLDTRSTVPKEVSGVLKANFANNLKEAGVTYNGTASAKSVYNALASVDKPGVADGRFLRPREVEAAIHGLTNAEPKVVLQALKDAHMQLPASMIGSGPKVLNAAIAKTAGAMPAYLRAVTHFRYDAGPISLPFRAKQFIKGNYISYAEGRTPGIQATPADRQAIKDAGWLFKGHSGQDQGIGASGTVLQKQGSSFVPPEQEKMITGLAASIAHAHGTTVEALMKDTKSPLYKKLEDSVSLVHSYGNGGYLNSPMAKTLNLVMFPSRFETKVLMETGKLMARLPAAAQIGVVASVANGVSFLNSSEGKKWADDNAGVIELIKAFTPLGTVQNFINFATKGGHLGDLGELGGLPVGILSSMLEHQGVNLGKLGTSQYTDPTTDKPIPFNVPNTDKARIQQGLTDLLSSMFSYPGRTAGLSSKTKLTQTIIPQLKPAAGETTPKLKDGTVVAPTSAKSSKTIQSVPAIPKANLNLKAIDYSKTPVPQKRKRGKVYGVRPN